MHRAIHLVAGWVALLLCMSFTYGNGSNPPIDYPRLLIADTVAPGIFSDEEITAFANIASTVWQSAQFYSGFAGVATLPTSPVNYLRTAAYALDSLAANQSRLAAVQQLLDVKLSPDKAAAALRAQAKAYRDADDDSMAFVIIEQVHDNQTFKERFWKQVQRISSGVTP